MLSYQSAISVTLSVMCMFVLAGIVGQPVARRSGDATEQPRAQRPTVDRGATLHPDAGTAASLAGQAEALQGSPSPHRSDAQGD